MQSQKDNLILAPIARLHGDFQQRFGTPRQGALAPHSQAEITLLPKWRGKGMLDGLEGFSHVWILSLLHAGSSRHTPGKIRPPRLQGIKVGVLASRSPHRPNPIGLTLARVRAVRGDTLWVSDVDLIDGTPILDLKPYVAQADRPPHVHSGWTESLPKERFQCRFEPAAEEDLQRLAVLGQIDERERLRNLILEVLAQDPRPLPYRHRQEKTFAMAIGGMNVIFKFQTPTFSVQRIEPGLGPAKRKPGARSTPGPLPVAPKRRFAKPS